MQIVHLRPKLELIKDSFLKWEVFSLGLYKRIKEMKTFLKMLELENDSERNRCT